jgi:hypothetical protein
MMHAMRRAMKSGLACAGLMSLAAVPIAQPAAGQTPNWQTYSYSTDGFSASFPAQPEAQKKNVNTDAGTFELRSYIGMDGEVALFVGVCDYGNATAGKNPDDLLQGAKNGALQNASAHLLSETKTTLGIYHGLTLEAESDQAHFSLRIYMVGSTLYQTLVVVPLGKPYADTARFLDSFQLIAHTTP